MNFLMLIGVTYREVVLRLFDETVARFLVTEFDLASWELAQERKHHDENRQRNPGYALFLISGVSKSHSAEPVPASAESPPRFIWSQTDFLASQERISHRRRSRAWVLAKEGQTCEHNSLVLNWSMACQTIQILSLLAPIQTRT